MGSPFGNREILPNGICQECAKLHNDQMFLEAGENLVDSPLGLTCAPYHAAVQLVGLQHELRPYRQSRARAFQVEVAVIEAMGWIRSDRRRFDQYRAGFGRSDLEKLRNWKKSRLASPRKLHPAQGSRSKTSFVCRKLRRCLFLSVQKHSLGRLILELSRKGET
jgi:hypothetical protein